MEKGHPNNLLKSLLDYKSYIDLSKDTKTLFGSMERGEKGREHWEIFSHLRVPLCNVIVRVFGY